MGKEAFQHQLEAGLGESRTMDMRAVKKSIKVHSGIKRYFP